MINLCLVFVNWSIMYKAGALHNSVITPATSERAFSTPYFALRCSGQVLIRISEVYRRCTE